MHDPSFTQYRTLPELYPEGSTCFMIGQPYYGCQGTVLKIDKEHKGRVQLNITEPKVESTFCLVSQFLCLYYCQEPSLYQIKKMEKKMKEHYFPGFKAAQKLGISSHLMSRITGSLFVLRGSKEADIEHASKVNVGLNLKVH